jgi:hypothetical protein
VVEVTVQQESELVRTDETKLLGPITDGYKASGVIDNTRQETEKTGNSGNIVINVWLRVSG